MDVRQSFDSSDVEENEFVILSDFRVAIYFFHKWHYVFVSRLASYIR